MPELTDAQLDQLITNIGLRPRKGPGARAACGTSSGYTRHIRIQEEPCDACRAANTAYKAAQARRPIVALKKLKPIAHGTPKGYKQHWYRREEACAACREANRADVAERARRRRGGSQ
ncbi:hypothetical protein [Streptomyces sp. NPDC016845]|uniref:hypothetical protein n=1 Tax=Streptomyces sp. NPDC016845 TaxID=3364972 RepID=UPI0037B0E927